MATNYHDSFIKKLQEIFMMDHAELDFGIYRIMNQKRSEIEHFLKFELLPQVKTALAGAPDGSDNEVFSHLVTFSAAIMTMATSSASVATRTTPTPFPTMARR